MSARSDIPPQPLPTSVQILSTILFAAFAIPVTIVALNVFWPAGVVIAGLLAWRGGFAPSMARGPALPSIDGLAPRAEAPKSSGNATFDAYRDMTLARLEQEQDRFGDFLDRLREARDKVEFDQFMQDRADVRLSEPRARA